MTEILAHRGSAQQARENTVAAFEMARELGVDGVELDVRMTADGVLVVHHDPALPGGEAIDGLLAGALPEWLPTLTEALLACTGLTVNVEVKSDNGTEIVHDPAQRTARATARACAGRPATDRLVISSFSRRALDAVREEAPELELAWLLGPWPEAFDPVAEVVERGFAGLHPHHTMVGDRLVAAARAAGLRLRTWTVDEPARVAELARLGVDAVITNDVSAARGVLRTVR